MRVDFICLFAGNLCLKRVSVKPKFSLGGTFILSSSVIGRMWRFKKGKLSLLISVGPLELEAFS